MISVSLHYYIKLTCEIRIILKGTEIYATFNIINIFIIIIFLLLSPKRLIIMVSQYLNFNFVKCVKNK